MFINISNHPSSGWGEKQSSEALRLGGGDIMDIPFPTVDPSATPEDVRNMASILAGAVPMQGSCVHIMGETSLVIAAVDLLRRSGIKVVVSTTLRKTIEKVLPEGGVAKTSIFEFVQFREIL